MSTLSRTLACWELKVIFAWTGSHHLLLAWKFYKSYLYSFIVRLGGKFNQKVFWHTEYSKGELYLKVADRISIANPIESLEYQIEMNVNIFKYKI